MTAPKLAQLIRQTTTDYYGQVPDAVIEMFRTLAARIDRCAAIERDVKERKEQAKAELVNETDC